MPTKRMRGTAIQEQVGARLREARRAAGISQEEAGRRLGLSRAGYAHLEDGTRAMSLDDLVKLARMVNHSPGYLLGEPLALSTEEDELLAAFRAIGSPRQRRLLVDLAVLAAKPEADEAAAAS